MNIPTTLLAAGLLSGGLATSAQAAHHHVSPAVSIKHRTLTITHDKLALRLRAGDPRTFQVDFGDDGSAEFQVRRYRFDRIVVNAGDGKDTVRIDESNGSFTTTTPTQINGQGGGDTLVGGSGAEDLGGGDGRDTMTGGPG